MSRLPATAPANCRQQAARVLLLVLAGLWLAIPQPGRADESEFEPVGLFLTWQRDPTTTMTVDWHTLPDAGRSRLDWRAAGDAKWRSREGRVRPFPFSERTIHRVELTGLEPAATYEFRFGDGSRTYRFRTMPADLRQPLRFAVGGDTLHRREWMEQTNRAAMRQQPDFIVWGGDLAYANGLAENVGRWHDWFDVVHSTLVDDEGRVVPIVVAVGNHEVVGGYYALHREYEQTDEVRARVAPYFYELFAFPGQPGYAALDFGGYLSLVLLDTDHTNPVHGAQTEWLARTLAERRDVPHVVPVYHVPAWPSHRSFRGTVSRRVRQHWVPLFEEHGVRVAFENHDHTYKRTHPLRRGRVADDGIVYMGDGAWGVGVREGGSFDEWYIAEAASVRHLILVTLDGESWSVRTIDADGDVIDEYPAADE